MIVQRKGAGLTDEERKLVSSWLQKNSPTVLPAGARTPPKYDLRYNATTRRIDHVDPKTGDRVLLQRGAHLGMGSRSVDSRVAARREALRKKLVAGMTTAEAAREMKIPYHTAAYDMKQLRKKYGESFEVPASPQQVGAHAD